MVLNKRSRHLFAIGLLTIVFIFIAAVGIFKDADAHLREQLLEHARLVGAALNLEHLRKLSGNESDLSLPAYQRLKEQLVSVKEANPSFRFLYLLGRNEEGEVFFFLDNELPTSRDYSPPGEIYKEASPELRRSFDDKQPFTEGPLRDEWGTWVSALVPIVDPQTGKTLAILGMDIDAHAWNWKVFAQSALPMVIVLLAALLFLAWVNNAHHILILKRRNRRGEILSDLRQLLQTCSTLPETGPIIAKSLQDLFPSSNGVLYLTSASRTDLEPMASWGEHGPLEKITPLLPNDCWGLRRGRSYIVRHPRRELICTHLSFDKIHPYACLPLVSGTEVLGLLHLCEKGGLVKWSFLEEFDSVSTEIIEIISLALANVRLREKLFAQSIKDPLTGLFNRRYLEETFLRETSRARRHQYSIGIIMADIDHFKQFNDIYGHAAGDAILAEVGRFLARSLRTADIVCRYGGEEFALILPEASLEHTKMRAEDLCRRVRDLRVMFEGQTLGPVTLSFGVAVYPSHGTALNTVLRAADAALYRAKQEGRNQVVVADVPAVSLESDPKGDHAS